MAALVNRMLQIHAWVLAALFVAVLCMVAMLLVMLHTHAGDVAYIAHLHRPVIILAPGVSATSV